MLTEIVGDKDYTQRRLMIDHFLCRHMKEARKYYFVLNKLKRYLLRNKEETAL